MLSLLFISTAMAIAPKPDMETILKHRLHIIEMSQDSDSKEARQIGLIEDLIGGQVETSLTNFDAQNLNRGVIKAQPWSGYYWANYVGGLGYRWADPKFPTNDWGKSNAYVRANQWNNQWFNYLSPAEKYDYVTGVNPSDNRSLTSHQWNLGRSEYSRTGKVETWQGICHGWAPASLYLPYPRRDVLFKFPQGDLAMKVDDIKALGSLYFANGKYETMYAGTRCNEESPRTNRDGRILDEGCFDVNPADWHIALVNLVGMRKEGFIIDAAENSEVWNHPVVSYALEYYDATNINKRSAKFMNVVREISATPNLRHRQFRSANAKYVVGVVSNALITVETNPGETGDQNQQVKFVYDLELDANFRIVGGEWRDAARPDFLWRPRPGSKPVMPADSINLDMWRMGDSEWQRASLMNSAQGSPIGKLVEEMFRLSAQ